MERCHLVLKSFTVIRMIRDHHEHEIFLVIANECWWPRMIGGHHEWFVVTTNDSWSPQTIRGYHKRFMVSTNRSWWPRIIRGHRTKYAWSTIRGDHESFVVTTNYITEPTWTDMMETSLHVHLMVLGLHSRSIYSNYQIHLLVSQARVKVAKMEPTVGSILSAWAFRCMIIW